MLWLVKHLESGPLQRANEFRKRNPQATIRVAAFDVPMTHYGHIERPKQLAGGIVAALKWLMEP